MRKTLLLLALFLWTGMQVANAQSRTVQGRILDKTGEGVPGASVKVKGTTTGTVTDIDGNYELVVPDGSEVLEVSSLTDGKAIIEIGEGNEPLVTTLKEDASQNIGEISIYGQKVDRRSFTGSVNTVTARDIARRPVTSVISALEGAAPGVNLTSGSGQPGSTPDIQMRGQNTLSASGDPLIVLDGAPYNGSLASINRNDIETMTILKDAAATSIYGSRGSNGVILLVSKRGEKTGKPRISIDGSTGMLNRFLPLYETLGAKDYLETGYAAYSNGPGKQSGSLSSADFLSYLGNYNPYNVPNADLLSIVLTDENAQTREGTLNPNASLLYDDSWLNELDRTGLRHDYNVAVSNGDDKSDYYFSVGYINEQGIIKNSTYDRISARLSVNSIITPWLKSGLSLNGAFDNQRFFVENDQQAYINPFMTAQTIGSIYPVYRYDSLGNRMKDANGDDLYDFGVNDNNNPSKLPQIRPFATNLNPIASLYQDDRTTHALNAFGNTYLEATFLKDFTLRSNFVLNMRNYSQNGFQNMLYGDAENIGGRMDRTLFNNTTYTFNQILTWKPSFGPFAVEEGHNLDIVLGHENYYVKDQVASVERSGFTGPEFQEGAAAAIGTGSSTYINELAMESYFAMLNYNFNNKYYLSASLRTDGSSRFAEASRWGTFWSVGAGWILNEESFLSDVSWINMLKVRGSYGIAGNEALDVAGYYAAMPRYSFNANNANPGLIFSTWGNPDLRWEGSFKFNVGFDYGLFANRINGTIDYFLSGADNLLFVRPFAPSVGTGGIYDNVGSMQNSGVEFQINADIIRKTNFNWNVRLNLTHLRNKITKVQTEDSLISGGTILAEGLAVNSFYLPHFAGVDPTSGSALYQKGDGSLTTDYGELTRDDYVIAGNSFRDIDGSFTSMFTYKNFDLSFLLSFGIGGKFYDGTYAGLMQTTRPGEAMHVDLLDRWRKPGDITDVPRVEYASLYQSALSDRFIVSNSFLNIKSINLGYTLPADFLNTLHFSTLRVYVAAENIYYLTARKGLNVQQDFFGSSSFNYFPYRTIMFGLNLGL